MTSPERAEAAEPAAITGDWSTLMARAQAGDRAAYRSLLIALVPYLRALCRRHGAPPAELEDVVQDVLLTLHAIRHTYDPARPFGPWIATIARRRSADRLRRHYRITAREVDIEHFDETFIAEEANFNAAPPTEAGLLRAIERLPPGQRQAITLLKLREMSLKEASVASGLSVGALKVATHRALQALRKMLNPSGKRDA